MSNAMRLIALGLFVGTIAVSVSAHGDETPAAAAFYPLVGSWAGTGKLSGDGEAPVDLAVGLDCAKTAGGWAVRCEMTAAGAGVTMHESDLMGNDLATGQSHWYAITDAGETHDHTVIFTGSSGLTAHYAWEVDGAKLDETIVVQFGDTLTFTSVVTADGTEIERFEGQLSR